MAAVAMALLLLPLAKTQRQCNGGGGDGNDGGIGGYDGHCHHNCRPCGLQWQLMAKAMVSWPLQSTATSFANGGGNNGGHCC
jgi:hypothetical protein